ncbi:MAG: flagellar biosynthesis anti-sigma factor FlgM [Bryobacterales bacterium]|nr:flagellar biosynthesis anti-sigma factor FlgM [Bryobacteraceae bacterium]MDW8130047.1 flagellar biosynthesis anti-sigma factor FlgM [Bryobacterales bacterium]
MGAPRSKALKIHDAYLPSTGASQLQQTGQTGAVGPARTEAERQHRQTTTDSVGLSELSVRLLDRARVEPPERTARIERLTLEVRSGRYQVDPLELARRIIHEGLER